MRPNKVKETFKEKIFQRNPVDIAPEAQLQSILKACIVASSLQDVNTQQFLVPPIPFLLFSLLIFPYKRTPGKSRPYGFLTPGFQGNLINTCNKLLHYIHVLKD